jgi:hypothetical protein
VAGCAEARNVSLVTDKVVKITPTGVVTADGTEHPADVLIYGTGFQASNFLSFLKIKGRGGRDLHESWAGDARAYLGMTHPGFPNLFTIYGPNTNIVVNGSIIFFSECAVRYIVGCLQLLAETGAAAMEPKQAVYDDFNKRVDEANAAGPGARRTSPAGTRTRSGGSARTGPYGLIDYWRATLAPNPGRLRPGAGEGAGLTSSTHPGDAGPDGGRRGGFLGCPTRQPTVGIRDLGPGIRRDERFGGYPASAPAGRTRPASARPCSRRPHGAGWRPGGVTAAPAAMARTGSSCGRAAAISRQHQARDRFRPSRWTILPSVRSVTTAGVNRLAGCRSRASAGSRRTRPERGRRQQPAQALGRRAAWRQEVVAGGLPGLGVAVGQVASRGPGLEQRQQAPRRRARA